MILWFNSSLRDMLEFERPDLDVRQIIRIERNAHLRFDRQRFDRRMQRAVPMRRAGDPDGDALAANRHRPMPCGEKMRPHMVGDDMPDRGERQNLGRRAMIHPLARVCGVVIQLDEPVELLGKLRPRYGLRDQVGVIRGPALRRIPAVGIEKPEKLIVQRAEESFEPRLAVWVVRKCPVHAHAGQGKDAFHRLLAVARFNPAARPAFRAIAAPHVRTLRLAVVGDVPGRQTHASACIA